MRELTEQEDAFLAEYEAVCLKHGFILDSKYPFGLIAPPSIVPHYFEDVRHQIKGDWLAHSRSNGQ